MWCGTQNHNIIDLTLTRDPDTTKLFLTGSFLASNVYPMHTEQHVYVRF